ncbi:MAG: ABC transporter permease [Oscillospiraceae bacterium]|nr:ABC transporter permease [Oscillospiraceae bacterium]
MKKDAVQKGIRYVLRRLLRYLSVLWAIVTINFILVRLIPGDPLEYYLGETSYYSLIEHHPEDIPALRARYGLDEPMSRQYRIYLGQLARFDFGSSYKTGEDIAKLVGFRLRWTLTLTIPAIVVSVLLGFWLGSRAGYAHGKALDRVMTPLMTALSGVPVYCMAIVLLAMAARRPGVFPLSGMTSGGLKGIRRTLDIIRHMILPCSTMIVFRTAGNYLFMRQTSMSLRTEGYVVTALTKGLSRRQIVASHIRPNALLPYVTMVCMQFGGALSGSLLIENVFSWKGMGELIKTSAETMDYPVIQACLFLICLCVVFFNILADLLCVLLDPRIGEERTT